MWRNSECGEVSVLDVCDRVNKPLSLFVVTDHTLFSMPYSCEVPSDRDISLAFACEFSSIHICNRIKRKGWLADKS